MAAFAAGDEGAGASGGAMTLAFASHNLGQVKRLATRVVYMEGGRILADLPVDRFFHAPDLASASPEAHLFVKGESL
jgi:tungstate transport system ATP-binding protein